jgi:SAM-dependent methyltransferase
VRDLRLLDVAGAGVSASEERMTLELYEQWAESYPPVPHNPLMRAEQEAMRSLWPPMRGRRALDLACGSGRYTRLLAAEGAAAVLALDWSAQMLRQVEGAVPVQGSMTALPFASGMFDLVICGLAVGHAPDLQAWMAEAARVLAPRGLLVYSDFHPHAADAGHARSFRDSQGCVHSVPHHRHSVRSHAHAAAAAGLAIEAIRELRVGIELRETFAGSEGFYRRWYGLPVVLAVRARKGELSHPQWRPDGAVRLREMSGQPAAGRATASPEESGGIVAGKFRIDIDAQVADQLASNAEDVAESAITASGHRPR